MKLAGSNSIMMLFPSFMREYGRRAIFVSRGMPFISSRLTRSRQETGLIVKEYNKLGLLSSVLSAATRNVPPCAGSSKEKLPKRPAGHWNMVSSFPSAWRSRRLLRSSPLCS